MKNTWWHFGRYLVKLEKVKEVLKKFDEILKENWRNEKRKFDEIKKKLTKFFKMEEIKKNF